MNRLYSICSWFEVGRHRPRIERHQSPSFTLCLPDLGKIFPLVLLLLDEGIPHVASPSTSCGCSRYSGYLDGTEHTEYRQQSACFWPFHESSGPANLSFLCTPPLPPQSQLRTFLPFWSTFGMSTPSDNSLHCSYLWKLVLCFAFFCVMPGHNSSAVANRRI